MYIYIYTNVHLAVAAAPWTPRDPGAPPPDPPDSQGLGAPLFSHCPTNETPQYIYFNQRYPLPSPPSPSIPSKSINKQICIRVHNHVWIISA